MKEVKQYLKDHGLNPTFQRVKIFKYLTGSENHPTVDEIYSDLFNEVPTLSKTTVYNTLKLLADKGLVVVMTLDEKETRYDAKIQQHGHFQCVRCKSIFDIDIDFAALQPGVPDSFEVFEHHYYLKGICVQCKKGG
jgi:Fe2+ or Zn2+ uptake regulation protein